MKLDRIVNINTTELNKKQLEWLLQFLNVTNARMIEKQKVKHELNKSNAIDNLPSIFK